jgi:hypothetical protein
VKADDEEDAAAGVEVIAHEADGVGFPTCNLISLEEEAMLMEEVSDPITPDVKDIPLIAPCATLDTVADTEEVVKKEAGKSERGAASEIAPEEAAVELIELLNDIKTPYIYLNFLLGSLKHKEQ